jgi:hypothetical protein
LTDYVQVAFYVVLGVLAVLVAAQAIATMRDISHQMLKDHQAQMRLLQR